MNYRILRLARPLHTLCKHVQATSSSLVNKIANQLWRYGKTLGPMVVSNEHLESPLGGYEWTPLVGPWYIHVSRSSQVYRLNNPFFDWYIITPCVPKKTKTPGAPERIGRPRSWNSVASERRRTRCARHQDAPGAMCDSLLNHPEPL